MGLARHDKGRGSESAGSLYHNHTSSPPPFLVRVQRRLSWERQGVRGSTSTLAQVSGAGLQSEGPVTPHPVLSAVLTNGTAQLHAS